jgi:acyl-CoA thioesterase YciA
MSEDAPPAIEPALKTIAMPADANPSGDIFGGWLLAQMDLAGGIVAQRRARGRVATVAVTAMEFKLPVFVGDEVACYGQVERVGRTSITVRVDVWATRRQSFARVAVTTGLFTYVAIDDHRKPRPVPAEGA